MNLKVQGTSKPPWGRSAEKRLAAVTTHWMVPPIRRKMEQAADICRGTCPTIMSPRKTATA